MHPGNIFVDVSDPVNPRYAAVDFGIVGTLDPGDQLYLAGNFLAFFERDYRKVAVLHLESGWVPAGTRVDELESAVRTVCEPIFNKPLKDISFGLVLLHLFDIARRFQMQIQPQLILLQKTLLNIEGLGRQLYPELDLWKTALPILRDWMRERNHPRALVQSLKGHWPDSAESIKVLPVIARRVVRQAYDDELVVKTETASLEALRAELRADRRRSDAIIAAAAVFISGILWTALATQPVWIGWLLTAGGALWLVNRLRQ
jgi:ubiquinone biosynthesis protein